MHAETLRSRVRRAGAVVAAAALFVGGLALTSGTAQAAELEDPPVLPPTVTADALPTWQINGVVWSQVVVGNTVYVTGSFTKARPPGVAAGGAGEVDANNIFAYDITTGNRVASFNHSLNAQGLAIAASPDGSRIYVGGDFTSVDGVARGHMAAFSTATNALVTNWAPVVGGQVRALAATPSSVYVGGSFPSAGGQPRASLAGFSATSTTLLPWAPTASGVNATVLSMVVAPDQSRVILAGSFEQLSGVPAYGMGSVDADTGAVLPWAANTVIRTAGYDGGITSLSTDGTQIFGTGYAFGDGADFEGTFAANPTSGAINWINDCLGDNYSTYAMNQVLYSVGHVHDCTVIGGFPDTSPRSRWQKAMASPTFPTGMITTRDAYGWDFRGNPYAGLLHWFPDLKFGTYTPDRQAAWSVTGNGTYIALGGEFPVVNNIAQQGLVRFAVPAAAPRLAKPIYATEFNPVATSTEAGRVRLTWRATWDTDDRNLRYDVYRDGGPSIGYVTADSNFWTLPPLSFTDTGVAPGTTHSYAIRASDKDGNVQWSLGTGPVTVSTTPPPAYLTAVRVDEPLHHWMLGGSGPTFIDSAGPSDGTSNSVSWGQSGAVSGSTAVRSGGGSSPKVYTSFAEPHVPEVTVQAWVQTTSTSGGRILGFGNSQSGTSAQATNDLVLYVNSSNRIAFATTNGSVRAIASARSINDGQWHLVTATAGADGMSLYVDGRRVGRDQNPVTMQTFQGYWRMFADQTNGLPNRPSNAGLSGTIDEVSVFPRVLTQAQVQAHYLASGRSATWSTPPGDAYAAQVTGDGPDLYWRLNETSGSTAVDSSTSGQDGTFVTGTSFTATASPASVPARAVSFNGSSGLLVDKESATAPKTYSTELWFRSTSSSGGKLIGFGSATTGLSSSYDRQVVLLSNGRLQFGTDGASRRTAETTTAYNNGQWHHVVATQGADGMKLYVDGVLAATNSATDAENFTGYWRVGGDRTFGGTSSNYVNAIIDEVAVYPTVLTGTDVREHYEAAGGVTPNQNPTASFTSSTSFLTASVNGSASSDPDGSIASYSWNWGDGTAAGSGATASHTYAAAGTYTLTLTVTDDRGATATKSSPVTVAANQVPVASFTDSATFLALSVNGSASSDPDGTVASHSWNWGDGTAPGSGATASHTYAAAGTYTVTLTVTDDQGATGTSSRAITVAEAPNQLPNASFTHTEDNLTTAVNGSGSTDPDGTIVSYSWNWGDGTAAGSGATASHTYAAAGNYTVVLTVTDNRGGTNTESTTVTVTAPPPNQVPTASFTDSATFLALSVNGSASNDPDGTIVSYSWNWGDGTAAGSGATASHTYAAAGTYTVTLTVTDDDGATGTSPRSVTVAAPLVLAQDSFTRSVTGGWGSADTGGAWTLGGAASRWSVANGMGRVSLNAGDGYTASLTGVSSSDNELRVALTTDVAPTGGGQYISVIGRRVAATQDYRAKIRFLNGAVAVWLTRNDGATETVLTSVTVPGLTYNAGDQMQVKLQTFGTSPTTVRVKIWKAGTTEPAAWTLSGTDSAAAFQVPGWVALYAYVSATTTNGPVVFGVDDLWVGPRN
jgi:PKD repeat protein